LNGLAVYRVNFGEKFEFLTNKNRKCRQKSDGPLSIEILTNFQRKLRIVIKNPKFQSKIGILIKNRNFTQKWKTFRGIRQTILSSESQN